MKRVLIIGYARHGKDTVAELTNIPFQSSSHAALDVAIWDNWGSKHYDTKEECFEDRVNHRDLWKKMIRDYNKDDKARLAKHILKDNPIYVGMRCDEELAACVEAGLFDRIYWVTRDDYLPPEPATSCKVTPEMADIIIDNNGTLNDLSEEAFKIRQYILGGV